MNNAAVLEKMAPIMGVKSKQVDHGPGTRVVLEPDAIYLRPGERQHSIKLAPEGIKQLATFAGVPQNLGGQLTANTYGLVVNELMQGKERYHVLMKDNEIVAFSDASQYTNTPPDKVLKIINSAIRGEVDYNRVFVDGYTVTLEIAGEKQEAVAKGDLVQGGSLVQFSPIGIIRPQVRAFVIRLVCTNGATSNDGFSEFNYSGEDDLWEWMKRSIRNSYKSLDNVVSRWQQLRSEKIPAADRALMLQRLIKDAKMTRETAEAVHARALEVPPETSYDMLNLVTWASSHVMKSSKEIMRAYNTVNQFTHETEHGRICPVCHRN